MTHPSFRSSRFRVYSLTLGAWVQMYSATTGDITWTDSVESAASFDYGSPAAHLFRDAGFELQHLQGPRPAVNHRTGAYE